MAAGTYQNFSRASKERFARLRRCLALGRVIFSFSFALIFRAISPLR
jgi:hypothetical protein